MREFPQTPGVYLMKDSSGRVIYIGKAKQLRSRATSYFLKGAEEEWRTGRSSVFPPLQFSLTSPKSFSKGRQRTNQIPVAYQYM